jgi:hypothetical protein
MPSQLRPHPRPGLECPVGTSLDYIAGQEGKEGSWHHKLDKKEAGRGAVEEGGRGMRWTPCTVCVYENGGRGAGTLLFSICCHDNEVNVIFCWISTCFSPSTMPLTISAASKPPGHQTPLLRVQSSVQAPLPHCLRAFPTSLSKSGPFMPRFGVASELQNGEPPELSASKWVSVRVGRAEAAAKSRRCLA